MCSGSDSLLGAAAEETKGKGAGVENEPALEL